MKLLDKKDKAAFVETLNDVKNGKAGTGQFTADGWRKYFNKQDYIMLNDGSVIEVDRPHIDKTVYYDDECEDPLTDNKKANWMLYNMRNFNDFGIETWLECKRNLEDHGCCSGKYIDHPYIEIYEDRNGFKRVYPRFIRAWVDLDNCPRRELTDQEIERFIEIVEELKANYIKRLETYYKKYSEQIYGSGYWANR